MAFSAWDQIFTIQPGMTAPGQVIQSKYLGMYSGMVHTCPGGNGVLPGVGTVTNADAAFIPGVLQRLGDQPRRVGKIVHPCTGADFLQDVRIMQDGRDGTQCHGKPARSGGFLPQYTMIQGDSLIKSAPLFKSDPDGGDNVPCAGHG